MLWRFLWMADFQSRGELGITKNRSCFGRHQCSMWRIASDAINACSSTPGASKHFYELCIWEKVNSIVESPCLAPNGWIEVAHYRLCSVSLISASQSSFSSLGLAKCIRRLCLCGGAWNTQRFIYKPTAYVCPAVLLNAFIRAWFTGMRGLFCFASLERMFTFILFIKHLWQEVRMFKTIRTMFLSLEL